MNPQVELNLALILFVPWFSILAVLFWVYPRQPRTTARAAFDTVSLVVSTALAALGMYWGYDWADPSYGGMWKQVVATMGAYCMFLAAITVAVLLRHRWLRRATSPESEPTRNRQDAAP